MTGYSEEELLGKTPRLFQGPRTAPEPIGRLRPALAEGRTFWGEAINYRKDGGEYVVHWSVSPVRLDGTDITHWVSSQRDLTDRRALERAVLEAQDVEKARIARDLHDGIAQQLAGVSMLAKLLARRVERVGLPESLAGVHDDLADLNEATAAAIEDVRKVSHGLMPVADEPAGLHRALRDLAATTTRLHPVRCEFTRTGDGATHVETANHLFRIVQEAVGNAVKHGGGGQIDVRLVHEGGQITVTVEDDGRGIPGLHLDDSVPPERAAFAGIGLRTMGFRASLVGGRLSIRPRDGGGTVVECVAPASGPVVAGE